MRFLPTEDDQRFVAALRDLLTATCTPEDVRESAAAGRHSRDRWAALADLGVTGLVVPQRYGGLGLDDRTLAQLLIESGRFALPEPLIEASTASLLLAAAGGDLADDWLPRIASGEALVVPVLEHDPYPAHLAASDLVVVVDDDRLYALPPEELDCVPQPNLDRSRPTVSVTLHDGDVEPHTEGPHVRRMARAAEARAATAAAAQLVGVGHTAVDLAVAYARHRTQFGRPIGSFQAVKHHLADALIEVSFARPLVERSAHSQATGDPDAGRHAAMAKAVSAEAAIACVEHSLQVHGAIGYTWECDLHLWLRRAYSLSAAHGHTESQWSQLDQHVLAGTVLPAWPDIPASPENSRRHTARAGER